jgi:hypothetical protein
LPAGIIEVEAVRQDAAAFNANGAIIESGIETPIVTVPGNTRGVFIDAPLIPPENATDPRQPLLYIAMSGRGSGNWPAGFLFREFPIGSDNYQLLLNTDKPAQIGQTDGILGTHANPLVLDTANSLALNFHTLTALESVTLTELQNNQKLNLIAIKNSAGEWEYVQFQTVVAGVAAAPYVSRYTISNLLRARFNTEAAIAGHATGKEVVIMNNAVKAIMLSTALIGVACDYKFITVGQRPGEIPEQTFTWGAKSLKALKPLTLTHAFDLGDGSLSLDWKPGNGGEFFGSESYEVQFRTAAAGGGSLLRDTVVTPIDLARNTTQPPIMISPAGNLPAARYTFQTDGGVEIEFQGGEFGSLTGAVMSTAAIDVRGGTIIEAQVVANRIFPENFYLMPSDHTLVGGADPSAGPSFSWGCFNGGTGSPRETQPNAFVPEGQTSLGFLTVAGDRISIVVAADGTVSYYLNYLGASSRAKYVSPAKIDFSKTYKLLFYLPISSYINSGTLRFAATRVNWLRNQPEYVHTGAAQMSLNGGVLPATVHVRVRQRSDFYPVGPASDWLDGSFTR